MLRPLPLACLRIVLLPCEAGLLPAFVDSVDEVLAEVGVELLGALLVGALGLCDVLGVVSLKGKGGWGDWGLPGAAARPGNSCSSR